MNNIEKYQNDLEKLEEKGLALRLGFEKELGRLQIVIEGNKELEKITPIGFTNNYNSWYSEALILIAQLMPSRKDDFVHLYRNEKRKLMDAGNYTISDYLIGISLSRNGVTTVDGTAALPKFRQQLSILLALKQRFKSSLFDIRQLVQADFFDSEIEVSKELSKKGFHRAAGVICGVVIEKHLGQVSINHNLVLSKKHPTISDFNDNLKTSNVIDVIVWRNIQRLGDIRNLCGHNKDKEPTKEEVDELIAGTDKIVKTIF